MEASDDDLRAFMLDMRAAIGSVKEFVNPRAHRRIIRTAWFLAAVCLIQGGYIGVGALNVAQTDATLKSHMREEAERWTGQRDSTGRVIVAGQIQRHNELSTNYADLAGAVFEWCVWIEDVMRENNLKSPKPPAKPDQPKELP